MGFNPWIAPSWENINVNYAPPKALPIQPAPIAPAPTPPVAPPPAAPPPLPPAPTPIDPKELAATLYDKQIPAVLSDLIQVGGHIIEGPIERIVANEVCVSFIVGYYIPMNYWDNTRTVTRLWIRGKEAWNTTSGALLSGLNVGGATTGDEQRVRFTTGLLSQQPDDWSIAQLGASAAVGYIPLVTGTFENIRIAQFDNVYPFTSVTVEDTAFGSPGDGIAWSDALATVARYDGRSASEFATVNMTGRTLGLIFGSSPFYLPDFLAGMRKLKPQWRLRSSDKLYVVEKNLFGVDVTIKSARLKRNGDSPIVFHDGDALDKPRERSASFIDIERDYETNSVRWAEDLEPVVSTDAFQTDDANFPLVSTTQEMISELTYAYYSQEAARETSEYTGLAYYLGIEPGDVQKITTDEKDYFHIATEVIRKTDYTVDVKSAGFLLCELPSVLTADPFFSFVVLLVGADGTDGSTSVLDESPYLHGPGSVGGAAQVDTAQFKVGRASALFASGVTANFSWADSDDWTLASSNSDPYTIETFVRFAGRTTNQALLWHSGTIGNFGWRLYLPSGHLTELIFESSSDGLTFDTSILTSSAGLANDTWYHVAVDHDATGKIRVFVNGVMLGSATPANSSMHNTTAQMQIGGGTVNSLNGWLDDVRITKGLSRYGSDTSFTPPTSMFPRT